MSRRTEPTPGGGSGAWLQHSGHGPGGKRSPSVDTVPSQQDSLGCERRKWQEAHTGAADAKGERRDETLAFEVLFRFQHFSFRKDQIAWPHLCPTRDLGVSRTSFDVVCLLSPKTGAEGRLRRGAIGA